jgi:hypothetical protein
MVDPIPQRFLETVRIAKGDGALGVQGDGHDRLKERSA